MPDSSSPPLRLHTPGTETTTEAGFSSWPRLERSTLAATLLPHALSVAASRAENSSTEAIAHGAARLADLATRELIERFEER